ncbi:uncharacterized protein [Paramormyrops kingsleyae]|uniref:uncharacterized protein isoform X2 n=1 Tax=Paramormyrops kingsleyae TaxID=1676925 RepID=UPI003B9726BD
MGRKKVPCPLCHVSYMNVTVHLRDVHNIASSKERKLLVSCKTGRFAGPLDCPITDCPAKQLIRLDKHLQLNHDLSDEEIKTTVHQAKCAAAKKAVLKHREEIKEKDNEMEIMKRRIEELECRLEQFEGPNRDKSGDSQVMHKIFFFDKILPDYKESLFRVGDNRRRAQNMKQELGYVNGFIKFMWGSSMETAPGHLKFLNDPSKLNNWVKDLSQKFKVTTCRNYLLSVCKFLQFLIDRRPTAVRLGQRILQGLLRHLKMQRSAIAKEIVVHRQCVKDSKRKRMPTRDDLCDLITELRSRIPDALDALSEDPSNINIRNKTIGALATYIFVCTGHRVSVLVNLTTVEFQECQVIDDQYVINVSSHKTSASFGRAKIALTSREHFWIQQFNEMRPKLPGYCYNPVTLFFSSSGEPLNKLCELVQKACLDCGMPRGFGVTDRFYVAEPELADLHRGRALLNDALGIGKKKATMQPMKSNKRYSRRLIDSDEDDCQEAVDLSEPVPSQLSMEVVASEHEKEADIIYMPLEVGEEVVEVGQQEGEVERDMDEVQEDMEQWEADMDEGEEDVQEVEKDMDEGEEDVQEVEKDMEEGEEYMQQWQSDMEEAEEDQEEVEKDEEEEHNIDFKFVIDSDKEEEVNHELPSPLPKYVEDIEGRKLRCRRRLVYPESLKAMVRQKFTSYWNQKITTQMINTTLMNNEDLLLSCKVLRMTIDNLRGLIKLLQRQDSVTIIDNERPGVSKALIF